MSGWLAVWNSCESDLDQRVWLQTVELISHEHERTTQYVAGQGALVSWRRQRGEFDHSGTIIECQTPGRRVAWVGQCLADQGDATDDAVSLIGRSEPSLGAVAQLNGPFAAAVFDEAANRLTVWTDRHGHYPVYLYQGNDVSVAGTDLRYVTPWMSHRQLNRNAVDLLLRCGELVDRLVLLDGVQMMPGGTCWRVDPTGRSERRYWRIQHRPDTSLSMDRVAKALADRMRTSVGRIEAACPRLGVPLSGGLDSRMILALCSQPHRVPSFTWGDPGCRDIKYATAFTKRIGSPHHVHHWDADRFPGLWPQGVAQTGGSFTIRDMFVLPFADLLAEHCDVTLNGLAGDVLMGGNFQQARWFAAADINLLAEQTWRWRATSADEQWADDIMNKAPERGVGFDLWAASLKAMDGGRPVDRLNDWLLENRIFRFTNCGSMLLRSAVESHAPFFDNDVVDLLLSVPVEYLQKHRLYLKVLKRASSEAASVPWQRTAIPPGWGFAANMASLGFHRIARGLAGRLGIDPFPSAKVADPDQWFRGPWKAAAERIILDERSLQRDMFSPDAVRMIWSAQQRGVKLARTIGVLITVELFARQFVDQARGTGAGSVSA